MVVVVELCVILIDFDLVDYFVVMEWNVELIMVVLDFFEDVFIY